MEGRSCSDLHGAPGPIDLWQLHYAIAAGKENNSNDTFIANLEEVCEGKWIRLTAEKDGSFQVFNSRNKFEKSLPEEVTVRGAVRMRSLRNRNLDLCDKHFGVESTGNLRRVRSLEKQR